MIVRLTGQLTDVGEAAVVIDRSGEAREVLVPAYAIGELAAHRGRQITLHTLEFLEGNPASGNMVPRILGFLHTEDRVFFQRFVGVKGIGPRKALKALTEPVRRVASWIEAADVKALTRLPGIGARAAELIIASLKGKMNDLAYPEGDRTAERLSTFTEPQRDAMEILVSLGDARSDAQRWMERAAQLSPDTSSADEWVRKAYRVKTGASG